MTTLMLDRKEETAEPVAQVTPLMVFEHEGRQYEVSSDMRLYVQTKGLVQALVPVRPKYDSPATGLVSWNKDMIPPPEDLAWLHDNLFRLYKQEIFVLYGKRRDGSGWEYVVPKQSGSGGFVEWADEKAIEQLAKTARWVGTIHSHPWFSPTPSGIDTDTWEQPDHSGLHVILGHDRKFTVTGSVPGHCFDCMEGVLPEANEDEPVMFQTSEDKPLVDLIDEYKPKYQSTLPYHYRDWDSNEYRESATTAKDVGGHWDSEGRFWFNEKDERRYDPDEDIETLTREYALEELCGAGALLLEDAEDQLYLLRIDGKTFVFTDEHLDDVTKTLEEFELKPDSYTFHVIGEL